MARFPTWLKISILIVVVLALMVAALIKVMLEKPPVHARVPAIQARFAEQIEALRELAASVPGDGCVMDESPLEVVRTLERLDDWWKRVDRREGLFDDPAILGAHMLYYCDGGTSAFAVKPYDGLVDAWSPSELLARDQWPRATLWYLGQKKVVRYEDRLQNESGDPTGFRIVLDPQLLEQE
jgi:hypothetical protein